MSNTNTSVDTDIHNSIMLIFSGNGYTKSVLQLTREFDSLMGEHGLVKNTHEWHKYRNLFITELVYHMNQSLLA